MSRLSRDLNVTPLAKKGALGGVESHLLRSYLVPSCRIRRLHKWSSKSTASLSRIVSSMFTVSHSFYFEVVHVAYKWFAQLGANRFASASSLLRI